METTINALAETIRDNYYAAGDSWETRKFEKQMGALGGMVAAANVAKTLNIVDEVEAAVCALIGRTNCGFPLYFTMDDILAEDD